uniref:Uncharacterized protein n=1 Tax=Anguilla anguilla TaxID=7936 RepID=A0A0E9RJ02_ANGAN
MVCYYYSVVHIVRKNLRFATCYRWMSFVSYLTAVGMRASL